MKKNDKVLYPVNFTEGWNQAVLAIAVKHPGVFDSKDFVRPQEHLIIHRMIIGGE